VSKNPGYVTRDWQRRELYVCQDCTFDTLSKGKIEEHVAAHRAEEKKAQERKPSRSGPRTLEEEPAQNPSEDDTITSN